MNPNLKLNSSRDPATALVTQLGELAAGHYQTPLQSPPQMKRKMLSLAQILARMTPRTAAQEVAEENARINNFIHGH